MKHCEYHVGPIARSMAASSLSSLMAQSVAARAIPAGGHTGEALACNDASIKPSFPAMKYAITNKPMSGRSQKHRDCIVQPPLCVTYFHARVRLRQQPLTI